MALQRCLPHFVLFYLGQQFLFSGANDFRGGTIWWTPDPDSIEKVTLNFRVAFANSRFLCQASTIRSEKLIGTGNWKIETLGSPSPATIWSAKYKCTEVSVHEDWSSGENSFEHTFNDVGPWVISFSGCCWPSLDSRGSEWFLSTTVDLTRRTDTGQINSSPISATFPVIRFQRGCPQNIRIPVADPDNDHVRCRLATEANECGRSCNGSNHVTLNQSSCTLRYDGEGPSGQYAVTLLLQDFPRETQDFESATPLSKVGLQFLVEISPPRARCNVKPFFTAATPTDGTLVYVVVGSLYSVSLVAQHKDPPTEVVEISVLALPGMEISAMRSFNDPETGQKLYARNVAWTPQAPAIGPHIFCFRALDKNGLQSDQRCIKLVVGMYEGHSSLEVQRHKSLRKPEVDSHIILKRYRRDDRCPSSKSGSLSGSFASPRYPKKTPRLKRCSWGITVPSGYRIQLVFNNFNTEERHRSNILKIYDGPSSSSRAIAFMNRQNSWGPVFSSGTSLWFDFWSGYERRKAFRATYTAIRLHSECPPSFGAQNSGLFASPNYPSNYPNGENCSWRISVRSSSLVKVEFLNFSTEAKFDELRIYDGPSASSLPLATLSGQLTTPHEVISTEPSLWFNFRTDDSSSRSGFRASYTEISGCTLSQHGSLSGSFTSCRYPNNYPANKRCTWEISVPSGYHIKLVFNDFDTEPRYDWLKIFNGPLGRQLGIASGRYSLGPVFFSSGSSMWFEFFSGIGDTKRGFHANYTAIRLPTGCPSSVSGQTPRGFTSPNYPNDYPNNEDCSWGISVPSGFVVKVEFFHFSTEANHDELRIYDGPSASSSLLATLSGMLWTPLELISTGTSLWFNFRTNSDISSQGFQATHTAVRPIAVSGCPLKENGSLSGSFASPGYPNDYPNNARCSWGITVPNGYRIRLVFNEFDTEAGFDSLKIFDGPSNSSTEVASMSGRYSLPGPLYFSSGSSLWFEFSSDSAGHDTKRKFRATYTAIRLRPGCPPSVSGQNSGQFTSPNYPDNYPNDADCIWRINMPKGFVVKVEFSDFDTDIYHDELRIHDGPSVSSPLLATLSGQLSTPREVISTGPWLWFNFRADFHLSRRGFRATYTALPGCPSSENGSLSGSVASPGYPSNYPNSERCSWGITVPSGYRIRLVFNEFDTEAGFDSLKIFDGPSNSSTEIASMSGRYSLPGPGYRSSGSSLWFEFLPDSGYTKRGFHANYTAIRLHSGCPASVSGQNSGQFTSPNYPNNYPNDADCIWRIGVARGVLVKVEFSDFNTERGHDELRIHDGPSLSSPLLATLSGQLSTPREVISTGPLLWFNFRTDNNSSRRGFRATYTAVSGCPSTQNGSLYGSFASPGYPNNYPNNKRCSWGITVPSGYRIQLVFSELDTGVGGDWLKIFDGPSSSSKRIASLSGLHSPPFPGYRSSGSSLWFEFSSDDGYTRRGFHANYTAIPPHSGCPPSVSGQNVGEFTSPNYPENYPNGESCIWRISVPRNSLVKVEFPDFNTERSHDELRIHDGPSLSSPLLATLSGQLSTPREVISTGPSLWFNFRTDNNSSRRGFRATFTEVLGCPSSINGSLYGSFASPWYPNNYPNSERCSWGITVPSGYRIQLVFNEFDTETSYDWLKIYDGHSSSTTEIASMSGRYSLPGPGYHSSGSSLWFKFLSDGSVTKRGFHANYTAIPPHSGCPLSVSGQNIGEFTSPNYPDNYPNAKDCIWRISVARGFVVKVEFFDFNTESSHDELRIRDGPSVSSPVLATLSGQLSTPREVISTGPWLWFNFRTDNSSSRRGFRATFTEVLGCPLSENGSLYGGFASPRYPKDYPNNARCSWGITVPSGYRIRLVFNGFRTDYPLDLLKIYDGPSGSSTEIASMSGPYPSRCPGYSSSGSSLWFEFSSDGNYGRGGFLANYTAIRSHSGCPSSITGQNSGAFTSPNYPNNYPNGEDCIWRISVPRGYLVKVEFFDFNTESSHDELRIHDGPSVSSPLLATLSGQLSTPREVISTRLWLWFNFRTDNNSSRRGFRATFTASSGCPSSKIGSLSGSFGSPRYPSNYLNDDICSWGITVPSGYRIQLVFNEFDTEARYDSLKIYDGPSRSSAEVASMSGRYFSKYPVYFSSGSSLWFAFSSDNSNTRRGFHANYTAIPPHSVPTSVCGIQGQHRPHSDSHIVGRTDTSSLEWPWQVGLKRGHRSGIFCGGSLINDKWVLTAAQCIHPEFNGRRRGCTAPSRKLWVILGESDTFINEGYEVHIDIAKVCVHPHYSRTTLDYDIALLELKTPIAKFNATMRPVCLPTKSTNFVAGTNCTATGFGTTREGGRASSKLQQVQLPIKPLDYCKRQYPRYQITQRIICAGPEDGGEDSCQGDSGGPFVCRNRASGRYVLWGAVSRGAGCARAGQPGVYTSIKHFLPWIEATMGKEDSHA